MAWVTGLAVWPSNLDVDASGAKVVSTLARRGGPLPRWLSDVAAPLAAAMIASGVGYLLLSSTVSQAAAVSLLLLIWVAGTGVALGRRSE